MYIIFIQSYQFPTVREQRNIYKNWSLPCVYLYVWNKSQYTLSTPIIAIHITLFLLVRVSILQIKLGKYQYFWILRHLFHTTEHTTSKSSLQITMILRLHNIKDYKTRFTNIIKKCSRKLYQPFYRFIMYDITFWLTSCKGICIKNKRAMFVGWFLRL